MVEMTCPEKNNRWNEAITWRIREYPTTGIHQFSKGVISENKHEALRLTTICSIKNKADGSLTLAISTQMEKEHVFMV